MYHIITEQQFRFISAILLQLDSNNFSTYQRTHIQTNKQIPLLTFARTVNKRFAESDSDMHCLQRSAFSQFSFECLRLREQNPHQHPSNTVLARLFTNSNVSRFYFAVWRLAK